MFTSFIKVHINGVPILINIMDISYVQDCEIGIRSDVGKCFVVDESFEDINNLIAEELEV